MNEFRRAQLSANMMVCNYTVRNLLSKIAVLEASVQVSAEEKFSAIKNIKDEITKVGTEIDSIKKEITLLNSYNLN
jgi:translation initiation factor 2B subunit (eIF-2B alpha/beta/delta family)